MARSAATARSSAGSPGGTLTPSAAVVIGNLTDAVALTVGEDGACVITKTAQVACWGYGGTGAFGDGTKVDSATARVVLGLDGVVVSASTTGARACALLSTGHVWCWGARSLFSTGIPTSDLRPVEVEGL